MLPEALEIGRVDLEVTERDGGGSMTIAGAWVLDRGLVIDGIEVMDPHALVTVRFVQTHRSDRNELDPRMMDQQNRWFALFRPS